MKNPFSKSAEEAAEKIDALEIHVHQLTGMLQGKAGEIEDLKAELTAQSKRLAAAQTDQHQSSKDISTELQQELAENRTTINELSAKNVRLEQQLAKAVRSRDNNKASVERMKKQRNRLRAALESQSARAPAHFHHNFQNLFVAVLKNKSIIAHQPS